MIFSVSIADAELKDVVKKAIETKLPGSVVQNVSIKRHDGGRGVDTYEATARVLPHPRGQETVL